MSRKIQNEKFTNGKYQQGICYTVTYAPVAKTATIRTILTICNEFCQIFPQMDMKKEFLNVMLREVVYMEIPQGFEKQQNKVSKLQKSLKGLK